MPEDGHGGQVKRSDRAPGSQTVFNSPPLSLLVVIVIATIQKKHQKPGRHTMFKILRFSLSAVLGLGVAVGAANAAEWKFNNGLPEGRGESKQLETFAADVAELSGGSLTVKVFHGGSLNLKDNDVARWLPRGAVEMGLVWANYLGRDVPALNAVMVQGSVGKVVVVGQERCHFTPISRCCSYPSDRAPAFRTLAARWSGVAHRSRRHSNYSG